MKKSLFLFVILFFASIVVFAQSNEDRKKIAETVQLYFDGMMERDRGKLDQAFVKEARLIGFRGNTFTVTEYEDWASGTASGEPRDKSKFDNKLVTMHIKGTTAVAETELYWPGIYYYDYLTLMKIEGEWKIVHKSWTARDLD